MANPWNRPNNPLSQKPKTSGLLPTRPSRPAEPKQTPGLGRSRASLHADRADAMPKKGRR